MLGDSLVMSLGVVMNTLDCTLTDLWSKRLVKHG